MSIVLIEIFVFVFSSAMNERCMERRVFQPNRCRSTHVCMLRQVGRFCIKSERTLDVISQMSHFTSCERWEHNRPVRCWTNCYENRAA